MKVAKEIKNIMRGKKGITLIALVITIIVLLILAGISITMLTGDNNILKQAINAKKNTIEGNEKEAIRLAYNGTLANTQGAGVTATNLEAELNKNGYNVTVEDDGEKLLIDFKDTKHLYSVDKNGNIEVEEDISGMTLVEAFKKGKIKVGDYLNYKAKDEKEFETQMSGTDTANGVANQKFWVKDNRNKSGTEIKWRILGLGDNTGNLDDNGNRLLLVAANSIERAEVEDESLNETFKYFLGQGALGMIGAEGAANNERILNEISNIYVNDDLALSARSIKIEDLNYILGIVVDEENNIIYQKNNPSENIDDDGYGRKSMGTTYNYKQEEYEGEVVNMEKMEYETKMIKDSTPESYLKGIGAVENGEISVTANAYAYAVNEYFDMPIGNTTIKDLFDTETYLFPGNRVSMIENGVTANDKIPQWGPGRYWKTNFGKDIGIAYSTSEIFSTNCSTWIYAGGVRPVIILKEDITMEQLN